MAKTTNISFNKNRLDEIITRGVSQVTVQTSLAKKLASGKPLRIKHGVDPTTADLHLGYAVVYRKLRQLQELGHTIIFLIGDFTARFGDPTDKEKTRVMRRKKDVEAAAKSYINQIGMMLDVKKLEIRRNSEWYDDMSAEELLRLMSNFTVARMLERDMFAKRMKEGKEIGLHEPVYPVLQAYDSVMLKADLTVIGTDQTFNELQARPLQETYGQAPQDVMSMQLLVGTDGVRKMSQSLRNGIFLKDSPEEMYGKIMSIPDGVVGQYFTLLTDVPLEEIKKRKADQAHLMDNKKYLAKAIVQQFYSEKEAKEAEIHFEKVVQHKEAPQEISTKKIQADTMKDAVALGFGVSKTQAVTLIAQGSVSVDEKKITNPMEKFKEGVYKKGKRHYIRLKKK